MIARPLAVAALALSLAAPLAAQSRAASATPPVEDAWVRLPAVAGRPAAGYFTVHGTRRADALVGVSTPEAERVELHSMAMENGVMKMRQQARFAVPAGGELKFAPGGNHLMLFGLKPGLQPGAALPLTLRFQSGATVTVNARTQAPGAPAPKAMGHAH